MNENSRRTSALLMLVFAAAGACVLMILVTRQGVGVSPDSTIYIKAARSLLAGNGFSVDGEPLTHFPPVYPMLLALTGFLQQEDPIGTGRLLAVVCYGVNLFLFGLAVQMCTARSIPATTGAVLFFLCSAPILLTHATALSEAPFITFYLAAFILLSLYIARPAPYLLLSAALMAGFAIAARYVGITLLPPMLIALFFFSDRPLKNRLKNIVLTMFCALLPLAVWLIRNMAAVNSPTDRTLGVHLFNMQQAEVLINTIHDFMLPMPLPGWIRGVFVSLFFVFLTVGLLQEKAHFKRFTSSNCIVLPVLCGLFFLTYIGFLVVSISFFEAHIPLDNRILLPALLALMITGIRLAWTFSQTSERRNIGYGLAVFALVITALNGYRSIPEAMDVHLNGRGYTSVYWRNSEIVSYLVNMQDDRVIYTNGPDVVNFLAQKETFMMPKKLLPVIREENREFGFQLHRMAAECRSGDILVAYLDGITWRYYLPINEELVSESEMPVLRKFNDGVIYGRNSGFETDQYAP